MYDLAILALASAWLGGAQNTDNDLYHTHASFAFIRTGERTPVIQPGPSVLTALGAQQMYKLGQGFRTRYIGGNGQASLGVQHIADMSQDTVNNDQILVQTLDSRYLMASTQAFMQGLYPPHSIGNWNGTGGSTGGLLANGSAVDFPLGGYQYANIRSSSQMDPESIYISALQNCPIAQRDTLGYFSTDKFAQTQEANADMYKSLDPEWFEGNLRSDQVDYTNAVEISDYIRYQYTHNARVRDTLTDNSSFNGVYDKIRNLADEEAWHRYGNTSSSGADSDNQAISGKALAAVILGAFQRIVVDRLSPGDPTDMSYPMTLLFGEAEPFISLMSLMMVDHRDVNFRSIPPFGSAMIFELFSSKNTSAFPTEQQDLWVRFHFHNGTDDSSDRLTAFPMFGNGPSRTDMQFSEFQDMFSNIMLGSLSEWCETCASSSLFCWGVDENNITLQLPAAQGKRHAVSPAVGGVIGAVVTLAVAGLLFGLAMLFGGVRFHRVERKKKSDLGGFKGSSKLASDPDLSIAKNGAPPAGISFVPDSKKGHERVGSWELRQKEYGTDLADQSRRSSFDAIDAVASKLVQPDERV